jgi:hypothetical protein
MVGREPQFLFQAPGMEARRPDLVFFDWDNGRDLYVFVVGSSPLALSYRECYVPGGAGVRAAAHKVALSAGAGASNLPGSRLGFSMYIFWVIELPIRNTVESTETGEGRVSHPG